MTKTVTLSYNVRVAQGHRFAKDVVREWPDGATLGDVMSELVTELESLGCADITVTQAPRTSNPSEDMPTNFPEQRFVRAVCAGCNDYSDATKAAALSAWYAGKRLNDTVASLKKPAAGSPGPQLLADLLNKPIASLRAAKARKK